MHITVCFEQPNCYKYFINKYCDGGSQTQTKDALISVQLAVDILTDCTVNERNIFFNLRQYLPACSLKLSRKAVPPSFPKGTITTIPQSKVPANLLNKLIHKL